MVLIDDYVDAAGGDASAADSLSIIDNNTSAFCYRSSSEDAGVLSSHASGLAIDVNPWDNPYILTNGEIDPPGNPNYKTSGHFMSSASDTCVAAFLAAGFSWGGNWTGTKDYQHFVG